MVKKARGWTVRTGNCAACSKRASPSEFYATCLALSQFWQAAETTMPFWAPTSVIVQQGMTARTLATEGKLCDAYIAI